MMTLEGMFGVRAAGSTVRAEALGGVTTFVTMAYILFVNGLVLGGAGLPPAQVLTVTALVAGVTTMAMGLYASYPFALAPGMGINAAVAGSLVATQHLTAAEAMGVIVTEGLAITVLVLADVRERVLDAIPTRSSARSAPASACSSPRSGSRAAASSSTARARCSRSATCTARTRRCSSSGCWSRSASPRGACAVRC